MLAVAVAEVVAVAAVASVDVGCQCYRWAWEAKAVQLAGCIRNLSSTKCYLMLSQFR